MHEKVAKALEYMPDDVTSLEAMANIVLLREEWHNVLGYYNKIIAKARESQQVIHAFLMKSYVLDAKLLLTEKAKQHYLRSLAFDQRQPTVLLRLAELSCRTNEWEQVIHWAGRGLALEMVDSQTKLCINGARPFQYGRWRQTTAYLQVQRNGACGNPWLSKSVPDPRIGRRTKESRQSVVDCRTEKATNGAPIAACFL